MSRMTDILEAITLCEAYMDGVDDGCGACPYNGRCKDLVPDTIKMLEDLAKRVPRWISVEERLPERYTDVAIIERDGVHWWYKVAYLGACDAWALNGGHRVLGDVTHWMPLPEPPEEDAE